ncbi:MAG: GTP-binding protein [Pseudomonadota bacterium]|nr:GTP-binding protein [Pseudomonadota bacterium]
MAVAKKVPVNLITGFFGVGKTTTITSMIERKPAHESWAVLVNEFGSVALDQIIYDNVQGNSGVFITEIPGGCICCATNITVSAAMRDILSKTTPDRLLIEPTGMGHSGNIIEQLKSGVKEDIIKLKPVICLVDARYIADPRIQSAAEFKEQVESADILVASKADKASEKQLQDFTKWGISLNPPKLGTSHIIDGNLDLSFLDLDIGLSDRSEKAETLQEISSKVQMQNSFDDLKMGRPKRLENVGEDFRGCGWIFSPHDVFDRDLLTNRLANASIFSEGDKLRILRLKGVFRVGTDWLLINRISDEITISPVSHSKDSRLEVIVDKHAKVNWKAFEYQLVNIIKARNV